MDGIKREEFLRVYELTNSIYYFLSMVFILNVGDNYRLIVIRHQHVLWDKIYHSLKDAFQAFSRNFKKKAWEEGVKPVWRKKLFEMVDSSGEVNSS